MGKRTKSNKSQAKPGRSFFRFLIYTFLLMFVIATVAGAVFLLTYVRDMASDLPSDEEILMHKTSRASIIYDRNGDIIAKLFLENRSPVVLQEISPWMIKATLAAEDSSFYKHPGMKISAILRAFWIDLRHKDVKQGGSTITQQLARNLFLTHERTIERKAKELILALRLERLFSKDRLLEMYLNSIYFGHGAWGIDTASRTYFGKEPSELDIAESSTLAGLIAAPERYTPLRHPERARDRQSYVLRRLEDLGWISEEEARKALEEHIEYKHTPNKAKEYNRAPYFVSNILFSELLPKYGKTTVYKGGLEIHTTLDLRLQEAAIKAVDKLKTEGALIALEPSTGEILAMVGGKNFAESKFNRAVQAYRQPGSAFKPFVYAAAFENGIMPIDHILDAPISFDHQGPDDKVWAPGNYSGKYHGEVTIIEALTHSYNTVSVRTAEMIGIGPVLSMARLTGITSQYLPHDLSASLGSASITPLELATAYSTFANGGKRVSPYSIRYIEDRTGQILESQDPMVADAISARTAVVMRSMLMDVVRAGTGRVCNIPGYEVFGKTGTTNEFMDAWFAGGTPGLVTIVYAGNDDHTTIGNKATGGKIAGPVWKDFMSQAVNILELPKQFDVPPEGELQMVQVCRDTGYLASAGCPAVTIYLPPENIPESICPKHGGDHYLASIDPRAPRVLLLPDDEVLYSKYRQPTGTYGTLPEMDGNVPLADKPVIKENKAPIPPSQQPAPYERDYSSPEQVEQRYQDLLKQYGIND